MDNKAASDLGGRGGMTQSSAINAVEPSSLELPPYDQSLGTKRYCIIGLCASFAASFAALGSGIAILATDVDFSQSATYSYPPGLKVIEGPSNYLVGELVPLVFNIFVTACTESTSYIHAVSLRWALYHEQRLEFNSNLRLFTSAKSCPVNCWQTNALSALCLVVSYTAASQTVQMDDSYILINGMALLMLGVGLFGLSVIAAACLRVGRKSILSWSPSPLNTALACIHNGLLLRNPGRGMLSVHDRFAVPQPAMPQPSQRPMISAYPHIRRIVRFQYVITALCIAMAVTVTICVYKLNRKYTWIFLQDPNSGTKVTVAWANSEPPEARLFTGFIFGAILQSLFVLSLHCAELLVNVSRDETAWRTAHPFVYDQQERPQAAGGGTGTQLSAGALTAALTNWPWLLLFVLKPLSGWMFTAQGARLELAAVVMSFNPVPLLVLAGLAIVLLGLEEGLVRWPRRGPQPAAYGHLQTLADLVDNWDPGLSGRLWWGAKGYDPAGVGIAGSSGMKDGIMAIKPRNREVMSPVDRVFQRRMAVQVTILRLGSTIRETRGR